VAISTGKTRQRGTEDSRRAAGDGVHGAGRAAAEGTRIVASGFNASSLAHCVGEIRSLAHDGRHCPGAESRYSSEGDCVDIYICMNIQFL
jgi:hypothetical protein